MRALEGDIREWIAQWNRNPRPYVWVTTADQILGSLARECARISEAAHETLAPPASATREVSLGNRETARAGAVRTPGAAIPGIARETTGTITSVTTSTPPRTGHRAGVAPGWRMRRARSGHSYRQRAADRRAAPSPTGLSATKPVGRPVAVASRHARAHRGAEAIVVRRSGPRPSSATRQSPTTGSVPEALDHVGPTLPVALDLHHELEVGARREGRAHGGPR